MLASFEKGRHTRHAVRESVRHDGARPQTGDTRATLSGADVLHFAPAHTDAVSCVHWFPPLSCAVQAAVAALPPLRAAPEAPAPHDMHDCFGKYVSGSVDGTVVLWHTDGTLFRKFRLEAPVSGGVRAAAPWLTDIVLLPRYKRAIVAFMNRSLCILDVSAPHWRLECEVVSLESSVMCMAYSTCSRDPTQSWLVLGDDSGVVHVLRLRDGADGLFSFEALYHDPGPAKAAADAPPTRRRHRAGARGTVRDGRIVMTWDEFLAAELLQHTRHAVHGEWVRRVQCGASVGSFLSCSSSPAASLVTYDPGTALDSKLRTFSLLKGVSAFDFSPALNIIVTGSRHGAVNVWNPHITSSCFASLRGHAAMVVGVAVRAVSGGQAVTASEDGMLCVWDLAANTCLQSLSTRLELRHPPVSAVLVHDPSHRVLLASAELISVGMAVPRHAATSAAHTHDCGVVGALYNPLFQQVVSCDESGMVRVFDVHTGESILRFGPAHGKDKTTCLAFDASQRRLITGSSCGAIKIWNFNIGLALFKMTGSARSEVTGVAQLHNNAVLATGWFRQVWLFRPRPNAYHVKPSFVHDGLGHSDDILSMALERDANLLATSAADGSVHVFRADTMNHFQRIRLDGAPAAPA